MSPRSASLPGSTTIIYLALLATCPGQGLSVTAGYVSNGYVISPPPAFVSLVEILPGGDIVTFDGNDLVIIDSAGVSTPVFTPPPSFGEVLRLEPGGNSALFSISPSYDVYRHDFLTGMTTVAANIPYLYDLDFDGSGQIVAAVGELTFATTSLERIDPVSFARTVFATLQGASGPIAPLASGDVVYGTNNLALATQSILQFDAGDITTALMGAPLDETDATILAAGLAGLTSFAIDGDGDLLFSENNFLAGISRIGQIDTAGGPATTLGTPPAGFFMARLVFAQPPGSFDPTSGEGATGLGAVYSNFATANILAVIEPSDSGGRIFGDCDGNGIVAITDVLQAMRHDVGLILLTGQQRAQCDVNGNAEVSVFDALVIAQSLIGIGGPLGY